MFKRPTIHGCLWQSKLDTDTLDHWVFEACKLLGGKPPREVGISEDVLFLSKFFDVANINLRHAGLLGWTAHWVNDMSVSTPDFIGDTFMESWCQAFAAKYCSEEQSAADAVTEHEIEKPDVVVRKRDRTKVESSRRTLF